MASLTPHKHPHVHTVTQHVIGMVNQCMRYHVLMPTHCDTQVYTWRYPMWVPHMHGSQGCYTDYRYKASPLPGNLSNGMNDVLRWWFPKRVRRYDDVTVVNREMTWQMWHVSICRWYEPSGPSHLHADYANQTATAVGGGHILYKYYIKSLLYIDTVPDTDTISDLYCTIHILYRYTVPTISDSTCVICKSQSMHKQCPTLYAHDRSTNSSMYIAELQVALLYTSTPQALVMLSNPLLNASSVVKVMGVRSRSWVAPRVLKSPECLDPHVISLVLMSWMCSWTWPRNDVIHDNTSLISHLHPRILHDHDFTPCRTSSTFKVQGSVYIPDTTLPHSWCLVRECNIRIFKWRPTLCPPGIGCPCRCHCGGRLGGSYERLRPRWHLQACSNKRTRT